MSDECFYASYVGCKVESVMESVKYFGLMMKRTLKFNPEWWLTNVCFQLQSHLKFYDFSVWEFIELLEYHLLMLLCYALILASAVLFLWSDALLGWKGFEEIYTLHIIHSGKLSNGVATTQQSYRFFLYSCFGYSLCLMFLLSFSVFLILI